LYLDSDYYLFQGANVTNALIKTLIGMNCFFVKVDKKVQTLQGVDPHQKLVIPRTYIIFLSIISTSIWYYYKTQTLFLK